MLTKSKTRIFRIRILAYIKANNNVESRELRAMLKLNISEFYEVFNPLVQSRIIVKQRTPSMPHYTISPHTSHLTAVEQLKQLETIIHLGDEIDTRLRPTIFEAANSQKLQGIKPDATQEDKRLLDRLAMLLGSPEPERREAITFGNIVIKQGDRFMTVGNRAGKIVTCKQLAGIGYRIVKEKSGEFTSLQDGFIHLPLEGDLKLAPLMDESGELVNFSFLYRIGKPDDGIMLSQDFLSLASRTIETDERKHANTEIVRIFDSETKEITEVPMSELAPGFGLANVKGVEGDVYIDLSTAKTGEYKHPPFDEKTRKIFKLLQSVFKEVNPLTVNEWEDGFRRDAHPMKELELWANMAGAFNYFTKGKHMSLAEKKDHFHIILAWTNVGADRALNLVELQAMSRKQAEGVIESLKKGNKTPR